MDGHLRLRLAAFYFTNFAAMGLLVPYFNIYARSLGFSDTGIGILLALVPLAKATLPGLWGGTADALGARRLLLILSAWGAALAFAGFLVAESFVACLVVMAVYAALAVPALPFVETTTLEAVAATGADYGRIRVAGSMGFAVTALLFGGLGGAERSEQVVPVMLALLVCQAVAASLVPCDAASRPGRPGATRRLLSSRPVLLLLAAGFLMQASHGAYMGFFSLVLGEAGYGGQAIGGLWAASVAAEVVMMLCVGRLLARLGTRRLLALSVALAAVRWAAYAASSAPAVLAGGQLLHAFTYAGFHVAAVQTIYRLCPPGTRATGQAFYSGWTFGAGMMVGTVSSGVLKDAYGSGPMFAAAGLMAVAALGLILLGAGKVAGAGPGRREPAPGAAAGPPPDPPPAVP